MPINKMKYIIKVSSTDSELLETIDNVIEYIVNNSNNQFIENNGYLFERTNTNQDIPVADALKKMNMELLEISKILNNNLIDIDDVVHLQLENSDELVITTIFEQTKKVKF